MPYSFVGQDVEYVTLKGWLKPIGQCRSFYDLPAEVSFRIGPNPRNQYTNPQKCRAYVEFVEKFVGVPIKYIGVGKLHLRSINYWYIVTHPSIGPKREDMIMR